MLDNDLLEKLKNEKFRPVLNFMKETKIEFKLVDCNNVFMGMATFKRIYLSEKLLNENDDIIIFVILHEIAHFRRFEKFGIEKALENLSNTDFEIFFNHLIDEEIFADRYACFIFNKLYCRTFNRQRTQQLHLEYNKNRYKNQAKQLFKLIENNMDSYNNAINKFVKYE